MFALDGHVLAHKFIGQLADIAVADKATVIQHRKGMAGIPDKF